MNTEMDIARPGFAPDASAEAGTSVPELAVSLSELQAPRSFRRPAEMPPEDVNEDTEGSDEAGVEEAAMEVFDETESLLRDPNAQHIINGIGQGSSGNSEQNSDTTQEIIDTALEEVIADVTVEATTAGESTVLVAEDGSRRVIELGEDERSREVEVGGETFLVLNDDLTEAEAQIEAAEFIAGAIGNIASRFGLPDFFEPFFTFLVDTGLDEYTDFYGMLELPRLAMISQNEVLNDGESREERRITKRRRDSGEFV